MNGFKNKNLLTEEISTSLLDIQEFARNRCWNIVIPPGFFSLEFAHGLEVALKMHLPEARIALISADGVRSPKDLIIQLMYCWLGDSNAQGIDFSAPVSVMLQQLLDRVGSSANIVIISEFHKLLGCLDEQILVALRTAEQSGKIFTIAISIYPYKWLKKRWKKEGHLLHVSNYGDQHKQLDVQPYEFDDILGQFDKKKIPRELGRLIFEWTGGVPEAVNKVASDWMQQRSPSLTPKVRKRLRSVAIDALQRVGKYVDLDGDRYYADLLIKLHQHIDVEESYMNIDRFHPWKKLLLNETGLRADALADALTKMRLEEAFHSGNIKRDALYALKLSAEYYDRGQYDVALEVVTHYREHYTSAKLHLTELHARIMTGLRGVYCPDEDADWRDILCALANARKVLPTAVTHSRSIDILNERYDALETFARKVLAHVKGNNIRLIDRLGGLYSDPEDREASFCLMLFQFESAKQIKSNTTAYLAVLPLLEQIIRLYGWWKYKLHYYKSEPLPADILDQLKSVWPDEKGKPNMPAKGKPYSSTFLFSYCLYIMQENSVECCIWEKVSELQKELSLLDTRNDGTHAIVIIPPAVKKSMFEHIEMWIDRIERHCVDSVSRSKALSLIAPLELP